MAPLAQGFPPLFFDFLAAKPLALPAGPLFFAPQPTEADLGLAAFGDSMPWHELPEPRLKAAVDRGKLERLVGVGHVDVVELELPVDVLYCVKRSKTAT